jgi:hypothetical protein
MSGIVVFLIAIVLGVMLVLTLEALFGDGGEASWKRRKS